MSAVVLRRATEADREAVLALLADAGLAIEGVAESFARFVVAAKSSGEVVGAAGLERYEDAGLVRSVVVAKEARGSSVGSALARWVLDDARALGVRELYLLTTSADAFFARLGFARVTRESVPAHVRASGQFAGQCCASATVMRLAL